MPDSRLVVPGCRGFGIGHGSAAGFWLDEAYDSRACSGRVSRYGAEVRARSHELARTWGHIGPVPFTGDPLGFLRTS